MNLLTKNCYAYSAWLKIKEEKWFQADFFMSLFAIAVQSWLYFALFRVVFLHSSKVDANEITLYYIIVNFVALSIVAAQFTAYEHMEDINTGAIIPYLLRPNSYLVSRYCDKLINVAIRLAINIVLIYVAAWIMGQRMSLLAVFTGIVSVLFGFTILYLIQAIIGCFAVWFHDITRFRDVVFSLLLMLGGRLLPSDLLFAGIKKIVYYTPLPYVYDVPVKMFMGSKSYYFLSVQLLWIVILAGIYIYLFRNHVRHNIEYGG